MKVEERERTSRESRYSGTCYSQPPQPITTKLPLFSASVQAEGILARAEMTAREGQKESKKEKEGERQRERA